MAFALVLAFVLFLGVLGEKPGKRAYVLVGMAALVVSAWEYMS